MNYVPYIHSSPHTKNKTPQSVRQRFLKLHCIKLNWIHTKNANIFIEVRFPCNIFGRFSGVLLFGKYYHMSAQLSVCLSIQTCIDMVVVYWHKHYVLLLLVVVLTYLVVVFLHSSSIRFRCETHTHKCYRIVLDII